MENKNSEDEELLRESMKRIQSLNAQVNSYSEPIAIIGMSCRFPGDCNTPEKFWEFISNGGDGITDIPKDRWDVNLYYDEDPDAPGKMYIRKGGFISQKVSEFDSLFFNISPTEAIDMDPQQRLLLELAWESLENSHYDPTSLKGSRTGVFIGIANPEYGYLAADKKKYDSSNYTAYWVTGINNSIASGRIAYFLGLEGPAVTIDTACSSSLVSTHLACESIRAGTCDMALAGGVNLLLTPGTIIGLCRTHALSPDGHCKTFEASADGYGRSEGGGIIILKRLSKAINDGDTILAVISGSAINQDGLSTGLTVPNGNAQEKVIRDALNKAKLNPDDISYFETHGTGTSLGDPIEVQSISNVLGTNRDKSNPLYLGAVKKNIGHTETAAGIAGIIKSVLCLKHKKLTPLKVDKINPMINFDKIPAIIPDKLIDWTPDGRTRNIGVSAFGISGTNAHMILSEAPSQVERPRLLPSQRHIVTLSAKTPEALKALIDKYCVFLEYTDAELADIAYSSNTTRPHFSCRFAVVAESKSELKKNLTNYPSLPKEVENDEIQAVVDQYNEGKSIDWVSYYKEFPGKKISLPNYPFQRKSYWVELDTSPLQKMPETNSLKGVFLPSDSNEYSFFYQVSCQNTPEIVDAFLDLQGSIHIGLSQEMLLNALLDLERVSIYSIHDMTFLLPMMVSAEEIRPVLITLKKESDIGYSFKFQSLKKGANRWAKHIQGRIEVKNCELSSPTSHFKEEAMKMGDPTYDKDSFYAMLDSRKMILVGSVRLVEQVWVSGNRLIAKLGLTNIDKQYTIPVDPGVYDSCAQLLHAVLPKSAPPELKMMVSKLEELIISRQTPYKELWCGLSMTAQEGKNTYCGEFVLQNEKGEPVIECPSYKMNVATKEALASLRETLGVQKEQTGEVLNELLTSSPKESQSIITKKITEILSKILTMPQEDINFDESITQYGMDSILGVTLKKEIEDKLGIDLPIEEIIAGPSVNQLSQVIAGSIKPIPEPLQASSESVWFVGERKKNAKFRLFCLPYGGGGATIYREWQKLLPEEIDVCPIQLAGRENRIKEKPYNDIYKLVDDLTEAILPLLDIPFAFLGHSAGALIAYQLTKNIREKKNIVPEHLFISAFTSPNLENSLLSRLKSDFKTAHIHDPFSTEQLTDQEVDTILQKQIYPGVENMPKEMALHYIKLGIADTKVVDSYRHVDDKISSGITVFYGSEDTDVSKSDMEAWKTLTDKDFHLHQMEGDHLFINQKSAREEMIKIIIKRLKVPS